MKLHWNKDPFFSFFYFQGDVVIWSKKDEKIEIPDGEIIKDKVEFSSLKALSRFQYWTFSNCSLI